MNTTVPGSAFAVANQPVSFNLPAPPDLAASFRAFQVPSMATIEMMQALPALADDGLIGKTREFIVSRDGEPDLKFTGMLLGSAAPHNDHRGRWLELRVYRTNGGNYVFSRIGRSMLDGERDKFEAETFNPKDHAWRTGQDKEWDHWCKRFFGFNETAKELYRRLQIEAAEVIE